MSLRTEQYEREGYIILRNVLKPELILEAQEHLSWLIENNPTVRPENIGSHVNDPFLVRLVSEGKLLDIAEEFIGPNIALYASHYISKPPFTGKRVLWHQDGGYWGLEPMNVITFWLAVDDSTRENGCLRVIPKTHRLALQKMTDERDKGAVFDLEIDPALVDESQAADMVMKGGDVEIHHPNIIHGSEPNLSPHRRGGLTIRYMSTDCRIVRKPRPIYLLRGEKVPGVNDELYAEKPKYVQGQHFRFHGAIAATT